METESLCKLPGPRARREPRTQIQAYPHWTGIWTILLPEPKAVLSWQDGPWTLSPSVASLGRSQAIFSHLSPPWILPPYGMCTCTHTHTHRVNEFQAQAPWPICTRLPSSSGHSLSLLRDSLSCLTRMEVVPSHFRSCRRHWPCSSTAAPWTNSDSSSRCMTSTVSIFCGMGGGLRGRDKGNGPSQWLPSTGPMSRGEADSFLSLSLCGFPARSLVLISPLLGKRVGHWQADKCPWFNSREARTFLCYFPCLKKEIGLLLFNNSNTPLWTF